jgi:cysteine-rich secretory family protein
MKKWTLTSALCCVLSLNALIALAQELGPPPMADSNDPGSLTSPAPALVAVNLNDRAAVVQLYQATYLASQGVAAGWNGNRGTCSAGSTSQAYADATILRVNYYRAMAGLPGDVVLSNAWNVKAQQAALMMSAQGSLSHSPDTNWSCYIWR